MMSLQNIIEGLIKMLAGLLAIGIAGGMVIPFQTSINSKLGVYTKSPIYSSAVSFGVGTIFLVILNLLLNPSMLTIRFLSQQSFNFYWVTGGALGVIFLTGNLLLLPRLGASLTVVITLTGQMIMGVIIDAFGWFGAPVQPFTLLKALGILLLIIGIILMNYVKDKSQKKAGFSFYMWLGSGFIFGFGPPLQTTINSELGQQIHSTMMASLISFAVGFIILLLMKVITNKSFQMDTNHTTYGKLKPFYFIGGALGVIFITVNIYLMPHLGAALTTIAGMLGQMIMALIIDQFGLLGIPKNKITTRKALGIMIIIAGIICLRFF